jgi:hypothetical protein
MDEEIVEKIIQSIACNNNQEFEKIISGIDPNNIGEKVIQQ